VLAKFVVERRVDDFCAILSDYTQKELVDEIATNSANNGTNVK